jgi:lipoyl(octanoyl) transferase
MILLRSGPQDGVQNMALDEAMLLVSAESRCTIVRLYSWDRPTVSFGRNQRCMDVYDSERLESRGVPAVRRLTGGRALLHARELTYSVSGPVVAGDTLRAGYAAINAVLIEALRAIGVPAELASPTERLAAPGLAPCFETPASGEIVVHGRKLVGSAQHRDAAAFLQHGSILLDDDQGLLDELASVPLPTTPPPATLRGCDPLLTAGHLSDAIAATLTARAAGSVTSAADTFLPEHHVSTAATRYRDPRWTWRR